MNQLDEADLEKRQAHLTYLIDMSILYSNIRGRKNADPELKAQVNALETHIATELQEFLTNG